MDCQDARLLLAFTRRGGDQIDPTERASLQQHLDACADCADLAESEQSLDAALGKAMRAVPVPAGLKKRLLTGLAANRTWPWDKSIAAAAAALLLIAGGGIYWQTRTNLLAPVQLADISKLDEKTGQDPDEVEAWFRRAGVEMTFPRQYAERHLLTYDVVVYEGRRVPKLVFFNMQSNTVAQVLVLRNDTFPIDQQQPNPMPLLNASHQMLTEEGSDCVYVVFLAGGGRDSLLGRPAN